MLLGSAFLILAMGCEQQEKSEQREPQEQQPVSAEARERRSEDRGNPDSSKVEELSLVAANRANAVLIVSEKAGSAVQEAVRLFSETVRRSTGADLRIVKGGTPVSASEDIVRLYIGDCPESREAGIEEAALPEEGYRMLSRGKSLFIVGRDGEKEAGEEKIISRPTLWALNSLLETHLGVRWLWPGELGTYVPKHHDFKVPPVDLVYQPKLLQRRLRIGYGRNSPIVTLSRFSGEDERLQNEGILWVENHQQGERGKIKFGHAFGHWWQKYSHDYPDYFAKAPASVTQPLFKRPDWVKLRLSNPAVIEQIAAEYEAAGAPEFWNVCPNDGIGFDLSEETRAWDDPPNQNPGAIWSAKANLTARYVHFWNLLSARLKEINPAVTISTYAYSCYKTPPSAAKPLMAKAAIGIVPGYNETDLWKKWAAQPGTSIMYLRPNWGHVGANAPHLALREMASFLQMAWENKMSGFDMDSLLGFWSTQGINYYLWARLMTHPELGRDDIIEEYTSAFGAGKEKIRAYFDFWEKITEEYAYSDVYFGEAKLSKKGKYVQLIKSGKIRDSWVLGPRDALSFFYTDEVLAKASRFLDEAGTEVGDSDAEALARIEFLRDGLRELRATRDLFAMGRKIGEHPSKEKLADFRKRALELENYREELSVRHVIWGARVTRYEDTLRVPIRPRNMNLPEVEIEGL